MMKEQRIRKARAEDLPVVLDLLGRLGLPAEGVRDHWESFVVVAQGGRVLGVAGLEIYDRVGLLRSVAVEPELQGTGLGGRLVECILASARERGLEAVYLLTTSADRYFPRFGFENIRREELDPRLEGSEELRGACPRTAVCMRLRLSSLP